jgi:hypothetical protein
MCISNKKLKELIPSSIISVITSIIVQIPSLVISLKAQDITRTIAGLNLTPQLQLHTSLNLIKNYPRYFNIKNAGPTSALQLETQLITYQYEIKNGKERVNSLFGTEEKYQLEELPPFKDKTFIISDYYLDVNARIQKPLQNNILEIRISYRRHPDMKKFTESAYYFINPEGKWVSENNGSLIPEIYNPIKKAVLIRSNIISEFLPHLEEGTIDPLHSVQEE